MVRGEGRKGGRMEGGIRDSGEDAAIMHRNRNSGGSKGAVVVLGQD